MTHKLFKESKTSAMTFNGDQVGRWKTWNLIAQGSL